MRKQLCVLLNLLIFTSSCFAQVEWDDQLSRKTTPSATVASLLKFNEFPATSYTGTPDISVPIYTVNTGKLSLPIVLRYNSSGIRVSENSGSTGLGWSLTAEGVISHSILGTEDNNSYRMNGLAWDNAALSYTDADDYNLMNALSSYSQDGAPDMYHYNFNGNSGSFIYADIVRTLPQKNLEISSFIDGSGNPCWKVVTDDGTQYFFEAIEVTSNKAAESISRSKTWYLSKIRDFNNSDSIMLEYDNTSQEEVTGRSFSFDTWSSNNPSVIQYDVDMQPNDPPIPGDYKEMVQHTHGKQLKRIIWNQGVVEYDIAWNDRQDLTTSGSVAFAVPRVKNILIKDPDNTVRRVIHFEHGYFETPNVNTVQGKRLKLLSVTFAADMTSLTAPEAYRYSFDYHTTPLPGKLSNSLDHWGYYNGANNSGLIPSFVLPGIHYYGANRNAHPDYVKAGMLTKMTLPTGGHVQYDWAIHSKDYPLTSDSVVIHYDSTIRMDLVSDGEELQAEWEDQVLIPTTPNDMFGTGLQAVFSVSMTVPPGSTLAAFNHADGRGSVLQRIPPSTTPTTWSQLIPSYGGPYTLNQNVTLHPGRRYSIAAHINDTGFAIRTTLKIQWPQRVIQYYQQPSDYVGGCRIAKITLYDNQTGTATVRRYEYPNCSVYATPDYHQPLFKFFAIGDPQYCIFDKIPGLFVSSNSIHSINSGNHVGYDWVKEITGQNGEGGYTINYYDNFYAGSKVGEIAANWRYGRLRESKAFNSFGTEVANTTYSNKISLNPAERFAGHTATYGGAHPCVSPANLSTYEAYFNQQVYDFPCDFLYTDTVIYQDLVRGTSNIQVNYFDNLQHKQLSRSVSYSSDGTKLTSFMKYPTDFSFSGTPAQEEAQAIQLLQNRHMHSLPIEQYVQKVLPGTSGPLTVAGTYKQFRQSNGTLLPLGTFSLEYPGGLATYQPVTISSNTVVKDGHYVLQQTATEFDAGNNILTVASDGDNYGGYVWGYKDRFPIAIVDNDSSSKYRAFTSFEKDAAGNWSFNTNNVITTDFLTGRNAYQLSPGNGVSIQVQNGAGGSAPHQTMEGLFIVSYWRKGGSVTVNGSTPSLVGVTSNGWTYCEHRFLNPFSLLVVDGSAKIDELRFHKNEARMRSYTYDPLFGMTSASDAAGKLTFYEYDPMGRLSAEKDIFGKILKKYTYKYLAQQ